MYYTLLLLYYFGEHTFPGSGFERWLFLNAHWTNTDRCLTVQPFEKHIVFCHEDMVRLSDQKVEMCQQLWTLIERIQRLELNPDECVITIALCLMNTSKLYSTA